MGGQDVTPKAAKLRALLALLLMHANVPVSRDELIEKLWDGQPPATAQNTLQHYVSELRKLLPDEILVTQASGYLIRVETDQLDARRFEEIADQGRRALARGEVEDAAASLVRGLGLWRGAALSDFVYQTWADRESQRLEERRLATVEDHIDARLALGHERELVPELQALVGEQPGRERLCGQLMLALYRSGRQADALEVYQRTRETLVGELGIDPSPDLQALYKKILNQDPTLNTSVAAADAQSHAEREHPAPSLPAASTPLIGRGREIEETMELLTDQVRLLTLIGPGGIGKTRLAIEIASLLDRRYNHGATFVDLAAVTVSDDALDTISQALGAPSEPAQPPLEGLSVYLRGRRDLLVLDNLEQVIEIGSDIATLLARAPFLAVLATSREPLRIRAERQYRLAPLAAEDAVAMFRDRAEAATGGELEEGNDELASLCAMLDFLPLALELAASRADSVPVGAMAEHLSERLTLLEEGPRDLPARQQTLRATLDWSHGLLSTEEQHAFDRLAIFAGGFTPEASAAVGRCDEKTLRSLVRKSLLRVDRNGDRLSMLETVRTYALEHLLRSNSPAEIGDTHARWFAELAERGDEQLRGPDADAWILRLEAEFENFRGALEWLSTSDHTAALRLCDCLWPFWLGHGHLREAKRWFDRLLAKQYDTPSEVLAAAYAGAGVVAAETGELDRARHFFQNALAYRRELGDELKVALALSNLGGLESMEGNHLEAEALARESVALLRQFDDVPNLITTLIGLGNKQATNGDVEAASDSYAEAVELARSVSDSWGVAAALAGRGTAALKTGDLQEAAAALSESMALWVQRGERNEFVPMLFDLGRALIRIGEEERGVRLIGASAALREELGGPLETADAADEREQIRSVVGAERFDELEMQGRALSEAEAIALATAS